MDTEKMLEQKEEVEDENLFRTIASGEKIINYTKGDHGFDLTIKFKLPNLRQKDKAETLYSKTFNKLLQDEDHLTLRELLDIAKKRKTWTEKDELRLATLDNEIIETKELVETEKTKKKKEQLEEKLNSLRDEKFRLALRVGQLTSSAIENLAEKERTMYYLQSCVFVIDENGDESPLYPTREAIEDEQNLERMERILLDGKSFWSGEGLTDFLHLGD